MLSHIISFHFSKRKKKKKEIPNFVPTYQACDLGCIMAKTVESELIKHLLVISLSAMACVETKVPKVYS